MKFCMAVYLEHFFNFYTVLIKFGGGTFYVELKLKLFQLSDAETFSLPIKTVLFDAGFIGSFRSL